MNNPIFFLVAATVIFMRENASRQRSLNVLVELNEPNITKLALGQIHQAIVRRLTAENEIPSEDIRDVVILNICALGQMSSQEFYGENSTEEVAETPEKTAEPEQA